MKFISEKKICIITQSHLCRNPRVLKEAITLAQQGHHVYILNGIYSANLFEEDKESIKGLNIHLQPIVDLTKTGYKAFIDKIVYKAGRLFIKYLGLENSFALGYGSFRYFKNSLAVNADLYICHQELATYIGTKLIKRGAKVAFDFEDWYSEDLLPTDRKERPVNLLRKIESIALNKGDYVITTSLALAKKLSQVYSCKQPEVIYNVFPSNPDLLNKSKLFTAPLKLFWFSQTVGPGRGIEEFISLLNAINIRLEFHLLGNVNIAYQEKLASLIADQHILYYHKLVDQEQLPQKIAAFDIGLALEITKPMSRNYTITNKFFQYLQSGLPVIASETDGQNEGFEKYKPGFKLSAAPLENIKALEDWLNNTAELSEARQRAIEAAGYYNWENESKKLIQLTNQVLERAG